MSSDPRPRLAIVVVVLSGGALGACVQSSGFQPPPEERAVNEAVIDGETVSFDSVTALRPSADEYGPGRRVLVSAVAGDLVVNIHLGSFEAGAQAIVPFSSPDVGANGGVDSAEAYIGVAGTLEVVEGSHEADAPLELEVEGLVLRQACTGVETLIERAIIRADVTINDDALDDPAFDFGAAGHVEGVIEHPTRGELPYIGIAGTEKRTLSSGAELWLVNTGDACPGRRHIFTIGLSPADVVDGIIDLGGPGASIVLLAEANEALTGFVSRTVATSGAVFLDDPLALDEAGAVVEGRMIGLTLSFVNDDNELLPDAPLQLPDAPFRTVMGAP